ncbi:unnamed protein product, partial [Polarella glacialis]
MPTLCSASECQVVNLAGLQPPYSRLHVQVLPALPTTMAFCGCSDDPVLVCGVILLSIHGLMVFRAAWSAFRRFSKSELGNLRQTAQHLFSWSRRRTETDLIGECVSKIMDERMVKGLNSVMFPGASFVSFIIAGAVYNMAIGRTRWMSVSQDVMAIFFFALGIVCYMCPVIVDARRVTLVYSLVMMGLCLSICLGNDHYALHMWTTAILFCFRVLTSMLYFKANILLFWNVLYCFASCGTYWQNYETQKSAFARPSDIAVLEVMLLGALVCTASTLRHSQRAEILAELSASSSHDECQASKSLLGLVCDVVVELDKDLVIVEHTPGFAAMLMLSSSKSTIGLRLQSFFGDPGEEQRFERHMLAAGTDSQHLAGTFKVDMHDSMGSTANFEMFHVQFNDIHGSACYIVGLREFTDSLPIGSAFGVDVPPYKAECPNRRRKSSKQPRVTTAVRQIAERGSFATEDQ